MGDNNYISYQEENGSINISEDVILYNANEIYNDNISEEVILTIVRAAVTEVEGVASLSTTAGTELAELIGLKSIPKGVTTRFDNNKIITDVIINVSYGNNVVNVAKAVQDSVRSVIQATTGFEDAEVNVHVSGISFER